MNNMPELKIGVVAVSRDCFPESLSVSRREALMKDYKEKYNISDQKSRNRRRNHGCDHEQHE